MGQNSSSANFESLPGLLPVEPVKKQEPPKRPEAPPQPKTPNYVIAQNQVLPGNIPLDGRSNLRPVSQELSKFMPEIADIYNTQQDEGYPVENDEDKENETGLVKKPLKPGLDGPVITPEKPHVETIGISNGIPSKNGLPSPKDYKHGNGDMNHTNGDDSGIFETEITINGVDIPKSKTNNGLNHGGNVKIRGHRRQQSVNRSLLNEESTIFEDPREHLYNEWRKNPYMNSLPSQTSLPVKSNFDMDESFNLTYAQLAEARRKSTLEELERRTGKKISDLSTDLADQSTVVPSPFDRYSTNSSSRPTSISVTRSNSTASSSDTGVSKRKKKRAPPPPTSPPSVIEPPVDYELDFSTHSLPRTKHLSPGSARSSSPASPRSSTTNTRKKGPAPIPGELSPRKANGVTNITVGRSPSFKTPPVVPKPPRQLSELELRLQSVRDQVEEKIEKGAQEVPTEDKVDTKPEASVEEKEEKEDVDNDKDKDDQKDETVSMSTDTVSTMSDNVSIYSVESRTKSETASVQMETIHDAKEEQEGKLQVKEEKDILGDEVAQKPKEPASEIAIPPKVEDTKASEPERVEKKPLSPRKDDNQKKLSTLLQHDIITAAQARGSRIVKVATPVTPKPKDEESIFKEQLAKALTDRDDRMKRSKSIDEMLNRNKSAAGLGRVRNTKKDDDSAIISEKPQRPESIHTVVKSKTPPPVAVKKAISTGDLLENRKRESIGSRTPSIPTSRSSDFSEEWTPEHDLDSDEDMPKDQVFHSHQRATSEGFKSRIIPGSMLDLKTGSLQRPTKMNRQNSIPEPATDEKNKFGSIRKLKKSVNKGVKNAFGSISRASGRILRRNKNSSDNDHYQQDQSNWRLSSTSLSHSYPQSKDEHHSDSDESHHAGVEDIRFDLPDEHSPPSPHDVKQMMRAGVAYVSGHGQLVVLPDFPSANLNMDDEENEGRAPKVTRKKKKKLTYESTVRKQERQLLEKQIAEQIREKELEIERERKKQKEIEIGYRKLRDLSHEEKLQKRQTEQMQQQMQAMHANTPPPPPPPQTIPQMHNFSHPPTFSHSTITTSAPHQSSHPIGMNFSPNLPVNSFPNLSSSDMNNISEYMRMMGIPPPSTPQQWSYLLSSVNLPASSPAPPPHPVQNVYLPTSGPDLSMLFNPPPPGYGRQPQATTQVIPSTRPGFFPNDLPTTGQMSTEKRQLIDMLSNGRSPTVELDHASIGTLLSEFHQGPQNGKTKSKKGKKEDGPTQQTANPVYYSSDEEEEDDDGLISSKVSNGIARVQVGDYRKMAVPTMIAPTSAQIVYDDSGFKTVIFNPASESISPRELDDSSSGADR